MSVPVAPLPFERRGAILLCGGRSTRMGRDKASLPFAGETLLQRTVRLAARSAPMLNVVCVAAAGQSLPPLPNEVRVTRDERPEQGPLAALGWGLRVAAQRCDAALVVGCDYPLLRAAFVEALFDALGEASCAATVIDGQLQPLPIALSIGLADVVEGLLADGRSSLRSLFDRPGFRLLDEREARRLDPELHSLLNCNDPAAYERALEIATQAFRP